MSANRDYFRHEASLAADDDKMFVGELTQGQITRLWQINLVRRLDNPDGTFAGVIAASYDTNSFTRFYREVDLGTHGLIAVVSVRDGNAWTMAGAGQAPTVIDIGNTPIFAAMRQSTEGSWSGASGLDDVDRIYAFATVPDHRPEGGGRRRSRRGDAGGSRLGDATRCCSPAASRC